MTNPFIQDFGAFQIRLYNQDCLSGMRKYVETGSVDVVVTSPPYNIGKKYNSYDDSIDRKKYLDWLEDVAIEIKRCMKDDGSFFLNIGGKPSDPWVPFEVISRMRCIFILQNVIHWIKSIAIEKADTGNYPGLISDLAVGHYQPVNSKKYLNQCHEYIFHLTKTGEVEIDRLALGVKYQDKSNIARWRSGGKADLRCRGNTWFIPYKTIQNGDEDRPHPSSFPAKLAEMCIRLHGLDKTKMVLDPFNGIGNTTAACINLGISQVGFEIDTNYYQISHEKCNLLLSQEALL